MALLKPGKDPSIATSFRPISLLCHTYKVFERLVLNRIAEHVDAKLIPEQAGFRPGKSCTSQLLNLTEHIEDGYEKRLITGAIFVDLSSAYDTVNHRRLLSKVLEMTGDVHLTDLIRTMLESRRFFVVLNWKKSRWRRQRNGIPQGSILAPMLFNIYNNDQPTHADTRSFIYADDLCIASQGNDFSNIEASLTSVMINMTTYYDTNQLRANPSKTQVCTFHLRNREAKRELNVAWNGIILSNTTTPVYLGIHLDRTLCYKTHIEKTNMKVNARNIIIRKLANLGVQGNDTQTSCLALCYSATEYACHVWARSIHAHKLNPALHDCCRIISGCLKPTNLDSVHILAGIAPPHIRRTVVCRMERTRQTTDARHQLFVHHQPAASRLKSRKSFMRTVTALDSSASSSRLRLWKDSLTDVPAAIKMGLEVAESLPAGSGEDWLCWRALNRLRTVMGRAKTVTRRWGYLDNAQSVDCDCGEPNTMAHHLSYRLLDEACTADDLATVTEQAMACARKWETFV